MTAILRDALAYLRLIADTHRKLKRLDRVFP